MKPSHFKTPRTLNECAFTPGYKSASFDDDKPGAGWILLAVLLVVLAVVVGSIL